MISTIRRISEYYEHRYGWNSATNRRNPATAFCWRSSCENSQRTKSHDNSRRCERLPQYNSCLPPQMSCCCCRPIILIACTSGCRTNGKSSSTPVFGELTPFPNKSVLAYVSVSWFISKCLMVSDVSLNESPPHASSPNYYLEPG